jgi:hypothetical protein
MVVSEHTLSEFLQHPNAVMPALARGPVVLHRRGADDLVVMTRAQNEAIEAVTRLLATVATGSTEGATGVLPWMAFLSPRDQALCVQELAAAVSTALTTGRFDLLADTLYAWEATGLAAWDLQNRQAKGRDAAEAPVEVSRPT